MANFFTDNEDILFHFQNMDLAEIVAYQEDDFKDSGVYDYAPENVTDAIDNYKRVLTMVGELAGDFVDPRSENIDREGNILDGGKVVRAQGMSECIEVFGKADLMGFTLPRQYGGLNCPTMIYTMAIDMVSRADASLMNIFGLQGIAETINAFASEEIKQEYLPRFSAGGVTGAMVLTEPDAGSDLQNIKLKAVQDSEGVWRLTGVKRFITNGCGEILLVLARSESHEQGGLGLSLFLVEQGEGIKIRRLEDKLGIHGSPTCELQFDHAPGKLIGERRRGLVTYVMALMNGARVGIAAQSLGIAQAAFNKAREYAYTRQQFGSRIERIPAVADMLAEMRLSIEAARALTYETSRIVDIVLGKERKIKSGSIQDAEQLQSLKKERKKYERLAGLMTPLSKYYASEVCVQVAYDAIQVLGGSGYMRDYPVERYMRDARITTIYEGTSQLQVVAAVRGVLSGVAEKRFVELAHHEYKKPLKGLASKLGQARTLLAKGVEYVKTKGEHDYTELYARMLVDIAIDIFIGYFYLRYAEKSDRRKLVAKRFINRALPRAKMRIDYITSGDRSTLSAFDVLVGPIIGKE